MRIVFLINSLEGGGAERVAAQVVSYLRAVAASSDEIHLVTLDDVDDVYTVAGGVSRHRLNAGGGLLKSLLEANKVFSAVRPDVVISFLNRSNIVASILSKKYRARAVLSERVNTSNHFSSNNLRYFYKLLIRVIYPMAESIVCVSGGVATDLRNNYGIPAEKLRVIWNPTDVDTIRKYGALAPTITIPPQFLVSVGRLTKNKNISQLVAAFAKADTPHSLVILGEGPERQKLQDQINRLGLANRILMPGFVSNPYAVIARSHGYISASLAEGFPNALVEAMCLGRPIASSDCFSGPSEILDGDPDLKVDSCCECEFGILFPTGSEQALRLAIELLSNNDVADRLRIRSALRINEFTRGKSLAQYADIVFNRRT